MEESAKSVTCQGCNLVFPSRNAVFTHLIQTNGACLDPDEYNDFRKYVLANRKRQKVMILYGYLPGMDIIKNGQDAAVVLLTTLARLYDEYDELTDQQQNELLRVNRSYGHTARSTTLVQQDEGTGAISEVLATRLPIEANSQKLDDWLAVVNGKIAETLSGSASHLRVFGKLDAHSQFNAEMDVAHRRIECLFPVDLLVNFDSDAAPAMADFFVKFPSLFDGSLLNRENVPKSGHRNSEEPPPGHSSVLDPEMAKYLYALKKTMQSLTTKIVECKKTSGAASGETKFPDGKRIRERKARNKQRTQTEHAHEDESTSGDKAENGAGSESSKKRGPKKERGSKKSKKNADEELTKFTLQRRRYHNFTPTAMAHEYLCLRRMDRFYHRATLRFDMARDPPHLFALEETKRYIRPYLVLSLTGDVFLNGQAARVFGLFSALARGLIDEEFIDCVFDEQFPHLVPTPALPTFATYAGEALYTKWEGKMQAVLSPRHQNIFKAGWNDANTLDAVESWTLLLRQHAVKQWYKDGVDTDGRLKVEKEWTDSVLKPWAEKAREQLKHYREWKLARVAVSSDDVSSTALAITDSLISSAHLGPLSLVDPSVPPVYQEVLFYLRQANESGLWPSTTPKRQLVMVSTVTSEAKEANPNEHPTSLSVQCIRARANARGEESSAYVYEEGQGGASGSFSVGTMPGDLCAQPKGNSLFPELMKAAFKLEIALCPGREPSSTIAINRNAQFKPHTDSGAGAGQSTSLIAGLGTYSGGELVVEGERCDIRYKAIEFNGWKQRHWTMPFVGERFSLVWFTPKGCEGVHGIDLCQ